MSGAEKSATTGALLVDKPLGLSSNRALQEVKKLYRARKAGHAGTLDPLASGLLVVLFGEATKLAPVLIDDDKEYHATLKLGERTTTGDAEGEVLEAKEVRVTRDEIAAVLRRFSGEIEQIPPMHSALKRGGVPLYKLARRGESVERAARRVRIAELELRRFDSPYVELRVRCSKGTYIRALAEDLGAALGVGAHLAGLRRTASGRLRVEDAMAPERLAALAEPERAQRLLDLPALLRGLPRAELGRDDEARFRQGQAVRSVAARGLCAVYGADGAVIGLGEGDGGLKPLRVLAYGTDKR
jgi:tRNA pseudouridine55 synthase